MHREWIDRSAHEEGVLQRRDPRLKVGLTLATLLLLVLGTRHPAPESWLRLLGVGVCLALLVAIAGVPWRPLLLRSLLILPFLAFVIVARVVELTPGTAGLPVDWSLTVRSAWLAEGGLLLARAWISVLVTLMLVLSTPLPAILEALERWHLPRGFLVVCSLVYRYLWVLLDEGKRLLLARRLRGARGGAWRDGGRIIAVLFARALDRADRIELALRLRGFDGRLTLGRPTRWGRGDTGALCLGSSVLVAIALGSTWLAEAVGR